MIDFKNLRSLEICGGGLTDAGVKNIKDLTSLTLLNLSQNSHLTDKSLEAISGIVAFFCVFFFPSVMASFFFHFDFTSLNKGILRLSSAISRLFYRMLLGKVAELVIWLRVLSLIPPFVLLKEL